MTGGYSLILITYKAFVKSAMTGKRTKKALDDEYAWIEKDQPIIRPDGTLWRPSQSDGCTSAPDLCFRRCCVEHDRAYHIGGGIKARLVADILLSRCLWRHGHPVLAIVYFLGVRVFGRLFFRWGWRRNDKT